MSEFKFIEAPQICPDCPLRDFPGNNEGPEGDPDVIYELGWSAPGIVSIDGRGVSFTIEDGKPITPRISRVAMFKEAPNNPVVAAYRRTVDFVVKGGDLDSGEVARQFNSCGGHSERRSGFLWLGKTAYCTTLDELQRKK